ncbi:MAG: M1 family metallopeptidase [Fidelibacterota bacterium]
MRASRHAILPVWISSILILFGSLLPGLDTWQQEVEYEIRVTLNDSLHTLTAQEILSYTNHSPDTLTFLWFHLWPNAYRNDSTAFARQKLEHYSTRFHFSEEEDRGYIDSLKFTIDGETAFWEFHPEWIDVARVDLPSPLLPGETLTVETPFFVKLPEVFSRLGHSGKHYEITQWYPKPAVYDREGWHPMPYLDQGEFYSEFGTFDVYITLPRDYRVMATGTLVDGDDEYAWLDSLAAEADSLHALDKKAFKKRISQLRKAARKGGKNGKASGQVSMKTLHFHQDNVHDFAWFADPNWIVRKGELWLADSTRKVTLWSMYLPQNAKLWSRSIEFIHDAGFWYSRFFGDYPYDHITAVDGDMSAGGGMEYPNITVISSGGSEDLLEFVIMHEVGHNWFYGILGSNERDHAFLDEGLNEYANLRYWEKKYRERNGAVVISEFVQKKLGIARNLNFGWINYLPYQIRSSAGDDQPIDLPSTEFHRSNYSSIVYSKTGIFTRFLQHYLGEDTMNRVMRDYYESWKFKHPSPEDFRSAFAKNVDEDLSWYFDDVINGTEVIDYAVVTLKKDRVTLANHGTLVCPVELAFYGPEGEELERRWLPGFTGVTQVSVPKNTRRTVIDPDSYMPDIRRRNNSSSKPLKANFVFDQPTFHHREVNLVPWIRWNRYNGTTPGLVAYSGYIPGYMTGLSVSPQWDFRNDRPVGSVSARRVFYRTLGFQTLTLSTTVADYSGRQGVMLTGEGLLRKPIVSTPSARLRGTIAFHHIRRDAVDKTFYDPGDHRVASLSYTYRHRPDPFLRYSAGGELAAGFGESGFTRLDLQGTLQWRYAKKLTLDVRGSIGSFVRGQNIPSQYRVWMSGGVDPDFEDPWVFNRTEDQTGPFNVYKEQFIPSGPSLRGRVEEFSTSTAWGLNLDHTLPYVPAVLFADAGGAADLDDVFVDGGFKISAGFIHLYFPLYQSWDKTPFVTGLTWLRSRARFQIKLNAGAFVGG